MAETKGVGGEGESKIFQQAPPRKGIMKEGAHVFESGKGPHIEENMPRQILYDASQASAIKEHRVELNPPQSLKELIITIIRLIQSILGFPMTGTIETEEATQLAPNFEGKNPVELQKLFPQIKRQLTEDYPLLLAFAGALKREGLLLKGDEDPNSVILSGLVTDTIQLTKEKTSGAKNGAVKRWEKLVEAKGDMLRAAADACGIQLKSAAPQQKMEELWKGIDQKQEKLQQQKENTLKRVAEKRGALEERRAALQNIKDGKESEWWFWTKKLTPAEESELTQLKYTFLPAMEKILEGDLSESHLATLEQHTGFKEDVLILRQNQKEFDQIASLQQQIREEFSSETQTIFHPYLQAYVEGAMLLSFLDPFEKRTPEELLKAAEFEHMREIEKDLGPAIAPFIPFN